jgi:hypothetical protein
MTNDGRFKSQRASRYAALLCALTLAAIALCIHPVVEMGMADDWSYVRTAQLFLQTGHIHYNGWAAPMLGWQIYVGAAAMRLFGATFTVARMTTVAVAMVGVFLFHRTLVRMGVTLWNATVTTLILATSPIYLALAFSYMTDMYGLVGMVLALYCCVRVLQAGSEAHAIGWVVVATSTNAIAGTARQTAWLGILVLIPVTLWLMRRWKRLLVVGALADLAALVFMLVSLRWLSHQVYAVPEPFLPRERNLHVFVDALMKFLRGLTTLGAFLLPITVSFVAVVWRRRLYRTATFAGALVLTLALAIVVGRSHRLGLWWPPFTKDSVSPYGMREVVFYVMGARPMVLGFHARMLLLALTLAGMVAVLTVVFGSRAEAAATGSEDAAVMRWQTLLWLVLPFLLGYFALMVPRATAAPLFDRYMIVPFAFGMMPLVRLYQDLYQDLSQPQGRDRLSGLTLVALLCVGLWSVAAEHDAFALYRGFVAAADEMMAAGVPRAAINSTWEFDSWTQILATGYINSPGVNLPPGQTYVPTSSRAPVASCPAYEFPNDPAVQPKYGLTFTLEPCMVRSQFAPVVYRTWLAPHVTTLYIVRYPER